MGPGTRRTLPADRSPFLPGGGPAPDADYARGLLGPVGRKNSWQLAEYAGNDTPHGLQHLLSHSRWDADGLRDDLQAYVAEQLGTPDGVLILDDTGFLKKVATSAGVQRQYSGTAGRTENCQIGVFAAYATTRGRALVDRELYLPKSWLEERERCQAARIPDERIFATKGELAGDMILRALASPLPIAWVGFRLRTGLAVPALPGRRRALLCCRRPQVTAGQRPAHRPSHRPGPVRGVAASVGGAGSQRRTVLRLGRRPSARRGRIRRRRADPPEVGTGPPQHQQARRTRLLPRLRSIGRNRHREAALRSRADRRGGGTPTAMQAEVLAITELLRFVITRETRACIAGDSNWHQLTDDS